MIDARRYVLLILLNTHSQTKDQIQIQQKIMAELVSFLESFVCSICQSEFEQFSNKPAAICTSFHLVCQQCLQRLIKKRQSFIQITVRCPFCKETRSQSSIVFFNYLFALNQMALSIRKNDQEKDYQIYMLNHQIRMLKGQLQKLKQKKIEKTLPRHHIPHKQLIQMLRAFKKQANFQQENQSSLSQLKRMKQTQKRNTDQKECTLMYKKDDPLISMVLNMLQMRTDSNYSLK